MVRLRRPLDYEWIGLLLAAGLSAVVMSFNAGANLSTFDGGISSSAATFTLHGLLPYRDYWLLYGPLSGFLLAIPTALLGPSVELTRTLGFLVYGCQALVAYRLARVWAAQGAAVALAVAAVVMVPAMLSLDAAAWPLAMTFALAALYVSIWTSRSAIVVGLLVGLAFITRLDVGAYALAATLVVRDRRAVLLGFGAIAVPFAALALATTAPAALGEQLLWFPLVGTRQFRGLPGPEVAFGQPAAAVLSIPLLLLPRIAIVLAAVRIAMRVRRREGDAGPAGVAGLAGLVVFAALCQLQTVGRADAEHFAQAATPALLLFAVWFPQGRLSPVRFGELAGITVACVVVGIVGHQLQPRMPAFNRTNLAAAAWVRSATDRDERIFVGLTSHRFTLRNPLILYYLADRAPGVRDALFNPGVTNTDWGQTRMVADLQQTTPPYLVLDRPTADAFEPSNDSRIPGSTILDEYLGAHYHAVCDLGILVIQARNDLDRQPPPCPAVEP